MNFAPKTHVWAMQAWPFLHSSSCSQSCADAVKPAGTLHDPPFATAWQAETAESVLVLRAPQQLSPAGQSHEYWQCTGASLLLHVAVEPAMHRPVGVKDKVTQHVLDRTSHVALPLQTSGL